MFKDYRTATLKKEYRSSSKQCKGCPLQAECLGRTAKENKFSVTYFKEEYDRNIERVESKQGRYMKAKRQSTIEPPDSYRDWDTHSIYGFKKDQYYRTTASQQGDVPLSHSF